MKQEIILYGNGGHARVIKDLILQLGYSLVAVFDHENPYNAACFPDAKIVITIGDNATRERISKEVKHSFASLIHPKATIAEEVGIGAGTVILANAVIQTQAIIGNHCIINAGAIIDHDVVIDDFVSIYPGAYIGGAATISRLKTVLPNQVIERGSMY